MAIKLQLRRGTTAENDLFTGALAEVTVDTNKHKLRVHDGSTQGGFPVALESDITDRISNCVTEIPQDIKLELNNGTLTLKAGSKVYVPNGAGVFDVITTTADITLSGASTAPNAVRYLFYNNGSISVFVNGQSGTTPPSSGTNVLFYNSSDNTIKRYTNGSVVASGYSFPLALIKDDGTYLCGSIEQVFNGIGYIGSHVFFLPGYSVLTPNGRNADGTLASQKYTFANCAVYTRNLTQTDVPLWVRYNGTIAFSTGVGYDPITNQSGGGGGYAQVATATLTGGVISNFVPKQPFCAVDYSDYIKASGTVVAEQLPTSSNNYTWFRKYANGWVEQGGKTTSANNASVTLPIAMSDANYTVVVAKEGSESTAVGVAPHDMTSTGFQIKICYNNSISRVMDWHVSGLAA